jgi:uncharacterized membrane protein (DUF106 family)
VSGSTGDAISVGARVSIAGQVIADAETLEETESRLRDLQRPMTEAEQQELEAARAASSRLEAEHGPDYHGFGHPPPNG